MPRHDRGLSRHLKIACRARDDTSFIHPGLLIHFRAGAFPANLSL
jgi:hypothetical protein